MNDLLSAEKPMGFVFSYEKTKHPVVCLKKTAWTMRSKRG